MENTLLTFDMMLTMLDAGTGGLQAEKKLSLSFLIYLRTKSYLRFQRYMLLKFSSFYYSML